jgi:hypothetical protein
MHFRMRLCPQHISNQTDAHAYDAWLKTIQPQVFGVELDTVTSPAIRHLIGSCRLMIGGVAWDGAGSWAQERSVLCNCCALEAVVAGLLPVDARRHNKLMRKAEPLGLLGLLSGGDRWSCSRRYGLMLQSISLVRPSWSRKLHCIYSQISLVTCERENLEPIAKWPPISYGFVAGLGVTQREATEKQLSKASIDLIGWFGPSRQMVDRWFIQSANKYFHPFRFPDWYAEQMRINPSGVRLAVNWKILCFFWWFRMVSCDVTNYLKPPS